MSDTAEGGSAAAGAAQSTQTTEPAKGAETKTTSPAPAASTSPPAEPDKGKTKPNDKTAEIEALRAQLEAEKAERAKLATILTEIEKARAAEAAQARAERRDAALDRLGILPGYRAMAPDLDPRNEEDRKALQKWADERPEIRSAARTQTPAPPAENSPLGQALAGKGKLPPALVQRMLGGGR